MSDKTITIYVNTKAKTVEKTELTFNEIIHLAYDNPPSGPNWVFTVTYHRGHGDKPEGSLLPGGTVKVKDGMIFDVTATDKS
jgi:multiubiquitin